MNCGATGGRALSSARRSRPVLIMARVAPFEAGVPRWSATHLSPLTDLNWLAETDHGELRLAFETLPVHDLLTAEVERWQPQSQARNVALSLVANGELPNLNLDRMRMSQALGNVISNAINCTAAEGSVALDAREEGEETLVISITDDGIGISPADLPHVFDRFYRTDQSRSRGVGGTGLGLAITRAIVEAHGGTIEEPLPAIRERTSTAPLNGWWRHRHILATFHRYRERHLKMLCGGRRRDDGNQSDDRHWTGNHTEPSRRTR